MLVDTIPQHTSRKYPTLFFSLKLKNEFINYLRVKKSFHSINNYPSISTSKGGRI